MSRTTVKTSELLKAIIDLILAGQNLSAICNLKGMPGRATVYRWLMDDPEFYKAYQKAVSLRTEETFQEIFEIADRPKETIRDVAADRLRVNARLRAVALSNQALKAKRPKKVRRDEDDNKPGKLTIEVVPPRYYPHGNEEANNTP